MNRNTMTDGSDKTRESMGRGGAALTQATLWLATALLGAFLTLAWSWTTRPGFSVFRWGWDTRDVAWVAPLGYVLVFAPFAVLAIVVALILRPPTSLRFGLFMWIALLTFSILLLFPQIHGYASIVLALAVGVQLSGVLARRPRGVRRTGFALAAVLGVMAIGAYVKVVFGRRDAEAKAITSLPEAAADAPNVLLIILDTVRAHSMSMYGFDKPTSPKLDEWAKRGVIFENAYSTAPWTLTSHASMFTGKYPSQQSSSWVDPLADSEVTVTELLRARGYATGGFTANLGATRYESGLGQGFIHYEDLKTSLNEIAHSTTITQSDNILRFWDTYTHGKGVRRAFQVFRNTTFQPNWTDLTHHLKSAEEVTSSFLAWHSTLPEKRPFFGFLNYFDAHSPYEPPSKYYNMFSSHPLTFDRYIGGIRYMDDEVDRLFRELESRGDLQNTVIILTADHGEQFGEHGLRAHGNSLYRQVIRVPLVVWYPPRVPAGRRVERQVTLRDVAATILDLTRVARDPAIGGTSLAGAWSDSLAATSTVFAELDKSMRRAVDNRNARGSMKALINDSSHVIRDGDAGVEAYAYRADPEETIDIAKVKPVHDSLGALLEQEIARHKLVWRTLDESKKKRP